MISPFESAIGIADAPERSGDSAESATWHMLPIAEAISLGKDVVVTGYGGNMDFCTSDNSYLVPFQLYRLEKDVGPYLRGNTWARPDVSFAADQLRVIYSRWRERATEKKERREEDK